MPLFKMEFNEPSAEKLAGMNVNELQKSARRCRIGRRMTASLGAVAFAAGAWFGVHAFHENNNSVAASATARTINYMDSSSSDVGTWMAYANEQENDARRDASAAISLAAMTGITLQAKGPQGAVQSSTNSVWLLLPTRLSFRS